MLSKNKLFLNSDDVFLIIRVIIPQLLKNFSFNQALFIKSLFVSQDFEPRILLQLVIKTSENLPKTTFSKPSDNFEPISNMTSLLS